MMHTCIDNDILPCPACIASAHVFTEVKSDHAVCIKCSLSNVYAAATGTRCITLVSNT